MNRVGQYGCQCGLAGSRRSPEQQRRDLALIDEFTEELSLADQVFLADKVGKRCGAHPLSQGNGGVGLLIHSPIMNRKRFYVKQLESSALILCLALSGTGWYYADNLIFPVTKETHIWHHLSC